MKRYRDEESAYCNEVDNGGTENEDAEQKLTFNVTSMSRNRFIYPSPFNFSLNLRTKPISLEDHSNDHLCFYSFSNDQKEILKAVGMESPVGTDTDAKSAKNSDVFPSSTMYEDRCFNPVSDQTPIITWIGNNFITSGGKMATGTIVPVHKGISTVDYTMVILVNQGDYLHGKLNYYKGACVTVHRVVEGAGVEEIRLKIKESRPPFNLSEPHRVWERTMERDTDAWRSDIGLSEDYKTDCLALTMTTLVDTTLVGCTVDIVDESFVQHSPNVNTRKATPGQVAPDRTRTVAGEPTKMISSWGINQDGGPYTNRIFVPCFRPVLYSLVGAYLYDETTETAFPVESTDVPSSMVILSQKQLISQLAVDHHFSLRRKPPERVGKLLASAATDQIRIYSVQLTNPAAKLSLSHRCGNWLRISTSRDEYYQLIGSVTKLLIEGAYRIIGAENRLYRVNVHSGPLPDTLPEESRIEILQFDYDSFSDVIIDVADIKRRQLKHRQVKYPMRAIEDPVVSKDDWRIKILGVVLPDFDLGRNWTDYQTNEMERGETNGVRSFDHLTLTISGTQINDQSLKAKTTPYPLSSGGVVHLPDYSSSGSVQSTKSSVASPTNYQVNRHATKGGTKSFRLTRPRLLPNKKNVLFTCDEGDSEVYFNTNIGNGILNFKFTDPLGRDLDSFERGPPHAPDPLGQTSITFQLYIK